MTSYGSQLHLINRPTLIYLSSEDDDDETDTTSSSSSSSDATSDSDSDVVVMDRGRQPDTVIRCTGCSYWARFAGDYHAHFMSKHSAIVGYRCSACEYMGRHRSTVNSHIRKARTMPGQQQQHSEAKSILVQPVPDHMYAALRRPAGHLPKGERCGYDEDRQIIPPVVRKRQWMEDEVDEEESRKKRMKRLEAIQSLRKRIQVMENKVWIAKEEVEGLFRRKEALQDALRELLKRTDGRVARVESERGKTLMTRTYQDEQLRRNQQMERAILDLREELVELEEDLRIAKDSRKGAAQVVHILQMDLALL